MIKRINIANFGSYKNFMWAAEMRDAHGNVMEFRRLNILYGRNYSGKTTLSRLIRCLETGLLPNRYEAPQFEVLAEGGTINQTQIGTHAHQVRVFNKDFVDANLSFLRDEAGGITPFAIVGQPNNDIQTQINQCELRLGNPETSGLRHHLSQKTSERAQKFSVLSQVKNDKTAKLTQKANKEIKTNRVYGHPSYTIDAITKDIDWIRKNNFEPFDEIEVGRHTSILRLITLDELPPIEGFEGRLEELNRTANALLTRAIRPTEAIQELLNDALLQDWVKKGIAHHRDKRSACAFCGSPLTADLWTKIDGHFSKESEDLEREIDSALAAIESAKTEVVRFEIQRGGVAAHNLSDGECSLIAFCYFMARLQDDNSEGKGLIVYIDDPISSLDGNHIFFVYGLIEGVLAKPVMDAANQKQYRYKQLFISTHNLEFLKFLKRLSKPKHDNEQFMVVMKANGSSIQSMPDYLRNYVTEFHFLFDQLCVCSDIAKATDCHHSFYNFGNNLRKFLEIYLFFIFPFSFNDREDGDIRMRMFFDEDPAVEPLVGRLVNELSHLGGAIDRGMQPIDYDEISRMSRYVLKKMKSRDAIQFEELLKAVGKPDPISAP